ncbi:IclR family transcriptional regulator domain-containing protein [Noviherbaspirillum sedimenti]|uniref:Transcriptional regulator n=1 Tax=Noviherbaspirillum sedimenti TaxID=2320865 RepID=A0A3A3GKH6_9BURK|nr:IclR family transcriptional regulator C-terminal domain-containing protein [Noviherbaspirillum sedimenti]RJG02816.1 transcriptional regulator [Noviherbaspirillum sedimenti]
MTSTLPVNALLRGLQLLETVNTYGPAGLAKIQRLTGLPKATVLRQLETLRQAGYIAFDPPTQTYQVDLRALALTNNFSYEKQFVNLAAPVMNRLRQKLGWPSDLAVFQHDKMVIVDTNRQPGMLSTNRSIGSRIPIMASATGRAYLANIDVERRETLLKILQASDDPYEALAKNKAATKKIIEQTRSQGYAISDQEFLPTNRGAAVAVVWNHEVACVINLIALASLVTVEDVHKRYVPMLLEARDEMEEALCNLGMSKASTREAPKPRAYGARKRAAKGDLE